MPKASIELVYEKLTDHQIAAEKAAEIVQDIERAAAAEAEQAKAERGPTEKKQFVIVVSDPNNALPNFDLVGWVLQITEDEPTSEALDKLIRASYEYNISRKGRRYPVKSIGEACEAVGSRFLKEQGLTVKTKTPVTVILSDNRIPDVEDDFPGSEVAK